MSRRWSVLNTLPSYDTNDRIAVLDNSEPDPSLKIKTMPRATLGNAVLDIIQKTNKAVGFELAGGTTARTLIVDETCLIDQDLSMLQPVTFGGLALEDAGQAESLMINHDSTDATYNTTSGIHNFFQKVKSTSIDVGSIVPISTETGINFFGGNPDYRIAFDNNVAIGAIRYNIDVADVTHCHAFTGGTIGGTVNHLACIRGDGKLAVGHVTPESVIDSFGDIRLQPLAVTTNPSTGHKLYSNAGDIFSRDSLGNVINITNPTGAGIWEKINSNTASIKGPENVDRLRIDDNTKTQNLVISQGPTNSTYTTSNGNHIFNNTIFADSLSVPSGGNLDSTKGINFFGGNPDYRIGFDSNIGGVAALRYNIDATLNTHCHVWSAGPLGGANNVLACLRGDGLFAIGDQAPQSWLDVKFDIKIGEVGVQQITPGSGVKIYSKNGADFTILDKSGQEKDLLSESFDSKWDSSINGSLFPNDALFVDSVVLKNVLQSQSFTLKNTGTTVDYTNSSLGGHNFIGGDVRAGNGLIIGAQVKESTLDVNGDIRVGEIATPTQPTFGSKLYNKPDGNLYNQNSSGVETQLTGATPTSQWIYGGNNILPAASPAVSGISIQDILKTQAFTISHTGTTVTYTNSFAGGAHSFENAPVQSEWYIVPGSGTLTANKGISFNALNLNDYKIGFDDNGGANGWIRHNIDQLLATHAHRFTGGPINASTLLAEINGLGDMTIANDINVGASADVTTSMKVGTTLTVGVQANESTADINGDIRVAEIAQPSDPTVGMKLFAESDKNLHALNSDGVNFNITGLTVTNTSAATYTSQAEDDVIVVDATSNSVLVIVDTAVARKALYVVVKSIGAGNSVSYEPGVGQTINGLSGTAIIALPGDDYKTYTFVPMGVASTEMVVSSINN